MLGRSRGVIGTAAVASDRGRGPPLSTHALMHKDVAGTVEAIYVAAGYCRARITEPSDKQPRHLPTVSYRSCMSV
jgi:hypothetical protein